jgi:hypothetical protein
MGILAAPAAETNKQLGAGQSQGEEIADAEEVHDENPTT